MDVTLVPFWVLGAGAAGGGLNAFLCGPLHLLPSVRRFAPRHARVPALGLVGNAGVGLVAATITRELLDNAACAAPASAIVASVGYACLGWAVARWATTESGNVVLRQAVCRAATAPAAHPSTIRTFLHTSSPETIYDAVDELMPRPVEHT
jgi:hypothetical protein